MGCRGLPLPIAENTRYKEYGYDDKSTSETYVAEPTATVKYKKQVETGRGSRVLNRSNNSANANGGVAYVNANNASSNTNANIGSRLAT